MNVQLGTPIAGRFLLELHQQSAMIYRPRFSVAWAARQARVWLDPSRLPGPRSVPPTRSSIDFFSEFFSGFFWVAKGDRHRRFQVWIWVHRFAGRSNGSADLSLQM
jgi:hypothetical protein